MTVVVTGANGFVGQRVVERCIAEGQHVVAVVQPGFRGVISRSKAGVIELDLADLATLPSVLPRAELIYHLAWVGVGPEARNDVSSQLPNLRHALDLVDAAAAMRVAKIVCPGSMSEFALYNGPVTGYEDPSPVDLYSATKVAARQLMSVRCEQSGVGLVWAFVTSVYGPGREDSNLLTYAIRTMLAGEVPQFTGLEQMWDYVYIDDMVNALVLLGSRGVPGQRYPVGSGEARPLAWYIEQTRRAIDPALSLGIGHLPYKSSTLDTSIPDISRLVRDTAYSPEWSFSDGLAATVDHFRSTLAAES